MRIHLLKTWPEHFAAIECGDKTFEARKEDGRGYAVGDRLRLQEWVPDSGYYTGRSVDVVVTHMLAGPGFGIEPEFVVMSIRQPPEKSE